MPGEPDDAVVEKVAKALREFDLSEANAGLLTDEEFHGFYHNAARAAIAAARPLIEREAWRPIETAPKDGTRILIARAGENVGPDELEITEWCSLRREHWEHIEGDLYRKVQDAPEEFWNGNGHRATHWMPLPEPPALASSEQGEG